MNEISTQNTKFNLGSALLAQSDKRKTVQLSTNNIHRECDVKQIKNAKIITRNQHTNNKTTTISIYNKTRLNFILSLDFGKYD